MAEQVAEKLPKYGHSEEGRSTKDLPVADSYYTSRSFAALRMTAQFNFSATSEAMP
jgi:hypothetical protein